MSNRLVNHFWPLKLPVPDKFVLMALADRASEEGHCWPSVEQICVRTCLSERSVRGSISKLETLGILTVERKIGRSSTYQFSVNLPPLKPVSLSSQPLQEVQGSPLQEVQGGVQEVQGPYIGKHKLDVSKAKNVQKTPLPKDFKVSDRVSKWAEKNGHPNPEKCIEGFVLAAEKGNYKYANWDSAFMTAIREGWKGVVPASQSSADNDIFRGAK